MPRFTDEWVVTKSLFEYTTGGSCACCSFPAIFDPNGLKGLINSVSDLETDAAENEFQSAQSSPWPPEMREHIWADRVKVRYKMKKEMNTYKDFFLEVGGEEGLMKWCKEDLGAKSMVRIFQMPRSEVADILANKYGICPAYGSVMGAVVDQVANFDVTKYEIDARGEEEILFENELYFHKRGGFIFKLAKVCKSSDNNEIEIDELILSTFVKVMKSLGGPKLLHRGPSSSPGEYGENGIGEYGEIGETDEVEETKGKGGPSFRSDRRIARLVIAKYWADQIMSRYKTSCKKENNIIIE